MAQMPKRMYRLARLVGAAALVAMTAACASSGRSPRPFPTPGAGLETGPAGGYVTPDGPTAGAGAGIVDTALLLRGTPYRNGGSTPQGFDCSGFTQWVFAQHGLYLPREVRDQFASSVPIDSRAIQPGDLLFFETVGRGASHVAIALGDETFVHAPSSNGAVRVERLTLPYWSQRFLGVRRVVAD